MIVMLEVDGYLGLWLLVIVSVVFCGVLVCVMFMLVLLISCVCCVR